MSDTSNAFESLRAAFEQTGIRYAVGGSWASTAYGDPRFTNDVDVLVEVTPLNLGTLLQALPAEFYVDPDDAARALRSGRSFNLIHMPSVLKFDLFPAAAFLLGKQELDRAVSLVETGLSATATRFVTPEDILLAKLHWFRVGGQVSEVQWRDIVGVITTCGESLDRPYLEKAARDLGVSNLLDRAFGSGSGADRSVS